MRSKKLNYFRHFSHSNLHGQNRKLLHVPLYQPIFINVEALLQITLNGRLTPYALKQGIVKIGTPFDWISILAILIMAIVYVLFKKKREFYGSLTFVIGLGIFGLLLRIPQTKEFFQNEKHPTFIALGIILPIALYLLVEWLFLRKMENEN